MLDIFLSHPNKLYTAHITNMVDESDTPLIRSIKLYHDIAKLKNNFQAYIREPQKNIKGKNHSLLSAYLFLLNFDFDTLKMLFGFFAIASHHSSLENFFSLIEPNRYLGDCFENSKELEYLNEVITNAKKLSLYSEIKGDKETLKNLATIYKTFLLEKEFLDGFLYEDFVNFKAIYSALIYSDKYEAIFNLPKEKNKNINPNIVTKFIDTLPKNQKRAKFREFVLANFDKNEKLFTLTAPTGYGKTLTSLEFALKFKKPKIIYALPFTSIIDQTYEIFSEIFKNEDINIFKIHHKTTIDEDIDADRYSKVKFLLNSFSGEINITTLYQLIFTFFGNSNKDNVKFNQLKNAVVIIDEAQALPYTFRQDFIKLCKIISQKLDTVFIFMSATMPVVKDFKELSNLEYFKYQNRYKLKWLPLENKDESLKEKIKEYLGKKHILCVVNTIKKAQELYLYFSQKNIKVYCLNGYMCDSDKQRVIKKIKEAIKQNKEKILLISTQTIEAGVDLDFEVGFREVAPISSIIQTAGRVNRNFGKTQATLYIFEDISGYSDRIYGDLQLISKTLFDVLKNKEIEEKDILELSNLYFQKIHNQLEKELVKDKMQKLAFLDINNTIQKQMQDDFVKELIVIEPNEGYIQNIQEEIFNLQNSKEDKFIQIDKLDKIVKELLQYSINVSINDLKSLQTKPNKMKALYNIFYLPYGTIDYDKNYGLKKYFKEESSLKDIFD